MEEQDESRDWGIEVDAGQPHTQGVGTGVVLTLPAPGKCETSSPEKERGERRAFQAGKRREMV